MNFWPNMWKGVAIIYRIFRLVLHKTDSGLVIPTPIKDKNNGYKTGDLIGIQYPLNLFFMIIIFFALGTIPSYVRQRRMPYKSFLSPLNLISCCLRTFRSNKVNNKLFRKSGNFRRKKWASHERRIVVLHEEWTGVGRSSQNLLIWLLSQLFWKFLFHLLCAFLTTTRGQSCPSSQSIVPSFCKFKHSSHLFSLSFFGKPFFNEKWKHYPIVWLESEGAKVKINFGQEPFKSTDFLVALC